MPTRLRTCSDCLVVALTPRVTVNGRRLSGCEAADCRMNLWAQMDSSHCIKVCDQQPPSPPYCWYRAARKSCASGVEWKVRVPPVNRSRTTSARSKHTHSCAPYPSSGATAAAEAQKGSGASPPHTGALRSFVAGTYGRLCGVGEHAQQGCCSHGAGTSAGRTRLQHDVILLLLHDHRRQRRVRCHAQRHGDHRAHLPRDEQHIMQGRVETAAQ